MNQLPLRVRVRILVAQIGVAMLRLLGLRDRVLASRLAKARAAREGLTRADDAAWPGLHAMDRKLDAIIDRDNGFFIEAGANDGYTQSNTYAFERFRGWTGLLVEPMEELYRRAAAERPRSTVIRAALVAADYAEPTVEMRFGDLMSTVIGEHEVRERTAFGNVHGWYDDYTAQVPARTLSALLDEIDAPAEIDLLSLDVEGFELSVLAGLDLERHAPKWMLIEVHDIESGRPPLEAALGERYVYHDQLSPLDLLFRRSDVTA